MANKRNNQKPITDKVYTPTIINLAKDKYCNLCDKYITTDKAESKDFVYTRTKRGSDMFVHKHCLRGGS